MQSPRFVAIQHVVSLGDPADFFVRQPPIRRFGKLEKPSHFNAWPVADQIKKIAVDPAHAGDALLAGNRGVYRLREGNLQKVVDGVFVDVVGVDGSILAAGRDGSIGRWDGK